MIQSFFASFLDILGKTHVHLLKDNVELAIFKLDALSLHHEGAMAALLVKFCKSLKYLNLALVERLFFILVLIFELFNGVYLASFNMTTAVDMAKRTSANKFHLLVLIPNNELGLLVSDADGRLLSFVCRGVPRSNNGGRRTRMLLDWSRQYQVVLDILLYGGLPCGID